MLSIKNLDEFSELIKLYVFDKIKPALSEMNNCYLTELNCNDFIQNNETKLIVLDILKILNNGNLKNIADEISLKICSAINARIYSNAVAKMVNEGNVDCFFSNDKNDFEFRLTSKGKELGLKLTSDKFTI